MNYYDYFFLYDKITMLENHGLTNNEQWDILSETKKQLKGKYVVFIK